MIFINCKLKAVVRICCIFLIVVPMVISATDKDKPVRIYNEKRIKGGYDFYGDNKSLIPYRVKIIFPKLENLKPTEDVPFYTVLPRQTKRIFLLGLRPEQKKGYSYRYQYNYYKGDCTTANHDDSYLYLFPFGHGTKHELGQGYHGTFTHFGRMAYALDFTMPIGTKIFTARGGLVVDVKEDSNISGAEKKYAKYGNYITIYHKDGTFARYVHLRQKGAIVKKGDKVKAGEHIGYSGNTGRSKGPHIHFEVSIPTEKGILQTIPTKFLNYDKTSVNPELELFYYSTHPGKPEYEIILGRNIKNEDYDNYQKSISETGAIKIRKKKIDKTHVLFVRNGFKSGKDVTVNFTLNNMAASKPIPITVRVPALTAAYLLYLRAKKLKGSSMYNYRYNYTYRTVH